MVAPVVAPPSDQPGPPRPPRPPRPPGATHVHEAPVEAAGDPAAVGEYTIAEAAQALGVHSNTIRRWIRKGRLSSRLAEGPGGPEHHIPAAAVRGLADRRRQPQRPQRPDEWVDRGATTIDDVDAPRLDQVDTPEQDHGSTTTHQVDTPWSNLRLDREQVDGEPAGGTLVPIQRAREMAEYTERLLESWRRRVEDLSRENGDLQAQLRQARQQLVERDGAAEEIGRLRAELRHTEAQLAAAQAAQQEAAGGATAAPARPWWKFW
jgi:transposase-like protein